MASLFVEKGAAMKTTIGNFKIPPTSMSSFDILSVAAFIFIYKRVLDPLVSRLKSKNSQGLTELQIMGVGFFITIIAMVTAGIVENFRLKSATIDCLNFEDSSTMSIFWQGPSVRIDRSLRSMYVGQLEVFNGQAPDGSKSFGSALCMTSISLGNYVSCLLVSIVTKISQKDDMPEWIPGNLNRGRLDRFYFLLAALTTTDFLLCIVCARWYKYIKMGGRESNRGSVHQEKSGEFRV